ncbi:hypothetical protein D0809_31455, partial [Flavobacterium circumlabens]
GEYVVAFLFKILIMYLMGIFLFYIESWNLTAKPAKEFLNGIKSQGTQGWRILLETRSQITLKVR